MNFPRHIAIIMDGNGRWAAERRLPRIQGHRRGAQNVRDLTTFCSNTNLEILTLYAFSLENWSRPKREIDLLMKLLKIYAVRERPIFMKQNVRLNVIGDMSLLPDYARESLEKTMELTSKNTGLLLQLAISYGGRDEIVRATRKLAEKVKAGKIKTADITEEMFSVTLDTQGQPDPDLVIRTSGEVRTSNYLIWQTAYSEFYFTETRWPDFDENELLKAVEAYHHRDRRFGGLSRRGAQS